MISGLPDKILNHVISFLATIDVVRTIILSHRWKKLWVSVPSLYLQDDGFNHKKEDYNPNDFARFVHHVLSQRGSTPSHEFSLKRTNNADDYPQIGEWIGAPVGNVVELNLHNQGSDFRDDPYELPISLFNLRSLVILRLGLEAKYVFIPPNSNCFPCLKLLDVEVFFSIFVFKK
ncbi:hypothetical protein ACLB2K_023133 [Fragaria x ananassa]